MERILVKCIFRVDLKVVDFPPLLQIHVLALLHRLSRHHPAEGQAGELPVESLRGAGRGGAATPVPDAPPRRGRGVHRLPDGPRAAPDAAAYQEPRLASAVPGPAAHDDPTASASHVRQRHRLRAHHPDQLLLHVQSLVDAVLLVMCASPCGCAGDSAPSSGRGGGCRALPPLGHSSYRLLTEVRARTPYVTQAAPVTVKQIIPRL